MTEPGARLSKAFLRESSLAREWDKTKQVRQSGTARRCRWGGGLTVPAEVSNKETVSFVTHVERSCLDWGMRENKQVGKTGVPRENEMWPRTASLICIYSGSRGVFKWWNRCLIRCCVCTKNVIFRQYDTCPSVAPSCVEILSVLIENCFKFC